MKVVLVAESGADIPKEIAEKEGIYIVPMHVTFDGETKDDGTFPASNIIDYFEKNLKIPRRVVLLLWILIISLIVFTKSILKHISCI